MEDSTGADRRELLARLSAVQKSSRGAAGYSRWVNRRLGRQLAALFYLGGLTPNQVSAISGVFTFASIACIAIVRPTWWTSLLIVLGLLLGYAIDSADGQVARLRGGGSPAGEWLDHVLDALKLATFHLAVAIAWFRFFHLTSASLLLVPLGFSAAASVFFFTLLLTDMLRRVHRAAQGDSAVPTAEVDPDERAPVLRSLVVLPNDYGVLCLCLVLLPAHRVFEVVYAALLAANIVFLVAGAVRWFRELDALGRG